MRGTLDRDCSPTFEMGYEQRWGWGICWVGVGIRIVIGIRVLVRVGVMSQH